MKNKTVLKSLVALVSLAIVIIVMLLVYDNFKPESKTGDKKIVVEVVIPEVDNKEFTIDTDALYLRQALEEINLVKGSESEFGLFVTEVNGRIIDDSKQEWWCFTKSGEAINTGVDEIAISDGDHYEITLKTGY